MFSNYHLDPSTIDLDRVKGEIGGRKLSPKRQILGDQLDARFARLREAGIDTLADLLQACKNKRAIATCASVTGISEEYLTILGREARGYLPQPVDLRRIPDSDIETVTKLHDAGLGDSKRLWERLVPATPQGRGDKGGGVTEAAEELALELEIDPEVVREFWQLADLARVPGVGPTFARLIHLSGYPTTRELGAAEVEELERRLREANAGKRYTSVMATQTDLVNCIRWGKELSPG